MGRDSHKIKKRGIVEAGFDSSAEELVDEMTLDEYIIEHPEATYLIKVKTSAMEESGILAGDTLVVERGRDPRKSDIVIILVEGNYQMRYFSEVQPGEVIEAVVTAVIRKYH